VGKLWGLFRKGLQYTDRPLLLIAGAMCVPGCHADVLVPHQSLHRWQIDATHDQPTHKGMAQVMEGKIHRTRLAYCMRKRCAEGSVWCTRTGPKHRAISGHTHSNCMQRGGQHLIHQHATTLAILDIGCSHSHYSAAEVDVFPGQRRFVPGQWRTPPIPIERELTRAIRRLYTTRLRGRLRGPSSYRHSRVHDIC
jgi:hypothetical protein